MNYVVIVAFGAIVGLAMGGLGGGGGVLIVPVLTYGLRYEMHAASAVAKLVVGSSSLTGLVMRCREGSIRWAPIGLVAISSLPAAIVGGRFSKMAAAHPFAVEMVLVAAILAGAVAMIRKQSSNAPSEEQAGSDGDADLPNQAAAPSTSRTAWLWILLAGAAVGFLGGTLGVGGGFLLAPALLLSGRGIREAISTTLAIISMNCAVGLAAGWTSELPWGEVGLFLVVALAFAVIGARTAKRLAGKRLRQGFAVFLFGLAAMILVLAFVTHR